MSAEDDAKQKIQDAYGMQYLYKLPKAVADGKWLVHSHVRPTRKLGSRGFRAWLSDPDTTKYQVCACAWAPELGAHYEVKRPA